MESKKFESVEQYFNNFNGETLNKLQELRDFLLENIPDGKEVISYNMPAIRCDKIVLYYAGYKNHIGLYPHGSPILYFKEELKPFKTSKGAIQLPISDELPFELIKKIINFRLVEILSSKKTPVSNSKMKEIKIKTDFLENFAAPARRALVANQILDLKDLENWTKSDFSKLHGIGKNAIGILHQMRAKFKSE